MRFVRVIAAVCLDSCFLLCSGISAQAQTGVDPERFAGIKQKLDQIEGMLNQLPPSTKKTLSSGAQNVIKLAQGWDQAEGAFATAKLNDTAAKSSLKALATLPEAASSTISRPATDFLFSRMAGFTQSETSTSWCGDKVVTGFNDSGSLFESLLFGPGGLSFSGASISSDKGATFRDAGYINPGADPHNFLLGDPVVTCTSTPWIGNLPTFYYSQIFSLGPPAAPIAAIAVSRSFDAGSSWESPVAAVQKDGLTHFLDKSWSAIDPANPQRIAVTYTDFDVSGTSGAPACGFVRGLPVQRTGIELVQSVDGGVTWSSPLIVAQSCFAPPGFQTLQGSQVAFDSAGNAYVAWESYIGAPSTTRALLVSRSTNHGSSFGPAVTISNVVETGDGVGLQGGFRNNEFPMLAIDRNSGALWVAWNDGRNFAVPDLEAADGQYHFSDILVSRSFDGGASWSMPVLVNPPQTPHIIGGTLVGTDHYQPGIAVDKTGAAAVCWYDRRNDPANFKFGRACSISTDSGNTWTQNFFINGNWSPWHATDVFLNPFYLGDYDTVGSDFLLTNSGFLGAYGLVNAAALVPNQDVAIFSIP